MFLRRPRPPMKRTTSMSGFSIDVAADNLQPRQQSRVSALEPTPPPSQYAMDVRPVPPPQQNCQEPLDMRFLSPENPRARRHSGEFVMEIAPFLRACGLCKRNLGPGRDTFMYRGEIAFCSLECRQQQMALDERKEKCSLTSAKNDPSQAAAVPEASSATGVAA